MTLVGMGADVNRADFNGATPRMESGSVRVAQALLEIVTLTLTDCCVI